MGDNENPFIQAISFLEASGIDYVIVGGFAVVMYGCNRFTPDLNVMVSHADTDKLHRLLEQLVAGEFIPVTDSDAFTFLDESTRASLFDGGKRWFFSFRHMESLSFSLDCFLSFPVPFQQVYASREELVFDGHKVSICSLRDLVAMKSIARRGQDQADIAALALIQQILQWQSAGKNEQEILDLGTSDAESEQIEGFLRFLPLTPQEKLDWLGEMLHHLGKFCLG